MAEGEEAGAPVIGAHPGRPHPAERQLLDEDMGHHIVDGDPARCRAVDNEAGARLVIDGTASGGVTINDVMAHVFVEELPFGGVGPSGMGAYHGRAGFLTFSHQRSVYRQSKAQEAVMLMRPPYGSETRQFLETVLSAPPG